MLVFSCGYRFWGIVFDDVLYDVYKFCLFIILNYTVTVLHIQYSFWSTIMPVAPFCCGLINLVNGFAA